MDIEIWPLDRIKPYPKNARKIPQKAIDKVARSLEAFGWQQPIVVDKHGVIGRPCPLACGEKARLDRGSGSRRQQAYAGANPRVPADG